VLTCYPFLSLNILENLNATNKAENADICRVLTDVAVSARPLRGTRARVRVREVVTRGTILTRVRVAFVDV